MAKPNRTSGRVANSKRFCILLGYYTSATQWHGNPVDGEMTRGTTTVYGIYIYRYDIFFWGTTSRIIISYHIISYMPETEISGDRLLRWASRRSLTLEDLGMASGGWGLGISRSIMVSGWIWSWPMTLKCSKHPIYNFMRFNHQIHQL